MMGRNSKLARCRTHAEFWRVAALLLGAAFSGALAIWHIPSREFHETFLITLRAIDIDHASLQRDVLQSRAGLLLNYDPLAQSISRMRASAARLRTLLEASGLGDSAHLEEQLRALSRSIDADEEAVERFKTDNALLQNSLSIATQLLDTLGRRSNERMREAMEGIGDPGSLLMRFVTRPDAQSNEYIRRMLDRLATWVGEDGEEVGSFAVHVRTMLSTLPETDAAIASIQLSHTALEAQELQREYLDAFGAVSAEATWSRVLLGVISISLCGYITVLLFRLNAQTTRLARQLEFQNVAAGVQRRFIEGDADMPAAFVDSVSQFAGFFGARRHAFATVSTGTLEVEQAFGDVEVTRIRSLAREFGPRFIAAGRNESDYRVYYDDGDDLQDVESWTTIGWLGERSISLFYMELFPLANAGEHEELMLGNAALVLARILVTKQAREEKKVLEDRLEHAQRLEAVGTLAGGIAHEFNNSLAAILGYAEMALQLRRMPSNGRDYLQRVVSSAQRAKYVVDQILTFGRKRERIAKPIDIAEAVTDILPLLKASMPEGIAIEVAIEPVPAVLGNPIEIQQILTNLCTNASHAMADNGTVRITARLISRPNRVLLSHGELPAGRYVVLTVHDSGGGIAPTVLPHIFEPFFTTKSSLGGTGLGLAAVHGIVGSMSGYIDVESAHGGTSFHLYFPASRKPAVPLSDFFEERPMPRGQGQIVLLVQQDESLRPMYEEKIAALGYEPVGLPSLGRLWQWMDGRRAVDLVVLDMDSCAGDVELASVVARLAPVRVVLLAEVTCDVAKIQASSSVHLLRKPVSTTRLAASISNQLAEEVQEAG